MRPESVTGLEQNDAPNLCGQERHEARTLCARENRVMERNRACSMGMASVDVPRMCALIRYSIGTAVACAISGVTAHRAARSVARIDVYGTTGQTCSGISIR